MHTVMMDHVYKSSLFFLKKRRYHYINKMHLSFTYFVAIAAVASLSSARSIERHGHQHKTPKGKAFDHFLQIWFENEASTEWEACVSFAIYICIRILKQ